MSDELEENPGNDSFEANSEDTEGAELEDPLDRFEDWGGGELEAAYLKALSALEASESQMPHDTDKAIKPPRIPVIDDELIVSERSGLITTEKNEDSSTKKVLTELLVQISSIHPKEQVTIVGATNRL